MKFLKTVLLVLLALGAARPAWGWWIFGRARGEVEIQRLMVNNISVDEVTEALALPRDLLADGRIVVTGRARAGRATIGAVEVSTDDQATWQMAEMAADGTFNYGWRPEPDVTYAVLVRATTTTGQTNRVDDTRLQVSLTDLDLRGMVMEALQRLVAAYQGEDAPAFMENVSRNFAGDASVLESAIRRDFSWFSDIRIAFTLSSLAVDARGRMMAAINFRRSLTSARDGSPYSDNGLTSFTFVQEEERAKVFSMMQPLIFGLSAAADVATGEVSQAPGTKFISVDEGGQVKEVTYQQLVSGQAEIGDVLLSRDEGYSFDAQDKVNNANQADVWFGFPWGTGGGHTPQHEHEHNELYLMGSLDLDANRVDDVSEVPANGGYMFEWNTMFLPEDVGKVFAIRTRGGKYAAMEITSFTGGRVRIRYKYQPDGSRFF